MGNAFLDAGIASPEEDSLVLLYRSSPTEEWQEHPDYKVIALLPTDGKGEVVVQQLSPGEYALALRSIHLYVHRGPAGPVQGQGLS
ncbi:MAG: hypothetical protein R2787_12300 [Saprospiraceae bacterium]